MITREKVLLLIAEEKEQYNSYTQLCTNYNIEPDQIAEARHQSIIETLEAMLKLIGKT
jgi:hypothetical protein